MMQISCKSEKESFVENRNKAIGEAWALLDYATASEELDLNAPLGFVLGCSVDEFYSHCEQLGKQYGGRRSHDSYQLYTEEFGIQDSVLISYFNYFRDPNTKTDTVAKVSFLFYGLGPDNAQNLSKVINVLDDKLAGWDNVEFNATGDVPYSKYEHYNKFWAKNNLVVRLEVLFHTTVISFINTSKYDVSGIKEMISGEIQISEEAAEERHERTNLPKVHNSAWDGSVYQVEDYLKKALKDPDSYEGIEWSNVIKNSDGTYSVRHKYRARNSFGGMVVENWVFVLDEYGNVISTSQL